MGLVIPLGHGAITDVDSVAGETGALLLAHSTSFPLTQCLVWVGAC